MCGIAGYLSEAPVAPEVLGAMTEALWHRGPDDAGYHRGPGFSGGMRRLSIVDLAGGQQPLTNQDGSVVLLYNGEIYNAAALRAELEAKGARFRSHSDGEVICHLYAEHGEDLFERLDGMFAAALWIAPEKKLILARDIPGEKPLYYAEPSPGRLAFASEIRALRRFPGLDLEFDHQALWDFPSFLWVPEPDTVYRHVKALPPGHLLVSDRRGVRLRRYENHFNTEPLAEDDAEVIAETRRVVEEAVRSRLIADVPLGSFLSGGLDSSIIAALAARELPSLATFSVGFEDVADPYHGRSDETAEAAAFARRIGSDHHVIRVTSESFRADLERFCRFGDQPFAVSSGLGILAVARAAREAGIKVLLSGDGADECFGGYSWYAYLASDGGAAACRRPLTCPAARSGEILSYQNFGLPLAERLEALRHRPAAERAWAWHYYAAEAEKARLFAPEAFEGTASSLRHFDAFRPGSDWTPEDFVRQDRAFYLPNEMLRKVDRMTMAWSVEGRAPFVAPAVLAHAEKLSYPQMVRDGSLKWALRRAFADILPAEVLARPKHGFNVPIDHWLRNGWSDLLDHTFSASSALARRRLIRPDAGRAARRMLADKVRLNGHTLFCYVMLNLWLEQEDHGAHR